MARFPILPLLVVLAGPALACSAGEQKKTPTDGADAGTRYRVGDFVEYRYSGAFTRLPVSLTEEIAARDGDRLEILVSVRRGEETRSWVQVVTDTPENRRAEKVDVLLEIVDGERRPLDPGRRELYRLYEWTIAQVKGAAAGVKRSRAVETFLGVRHDCEVESGVFQSREGKAPFRFLTCPDFLWTNGPARITSPEGHVLWQREVVASGKR